MEESKEELEQLKKDIMKEKQRYLMVAMEREEQLHKQIEFLEQKRQELEKLKKEQEEAAAKAATASEQEEAEQQAQAAFGMTQGAGQPAAQPEAESASQEAQSKTEAANQELLDQQKKLISQQYGILTLLNGVLNNLMTKDKATVIQAMKNYGMNESQIKKLEAYIMSHQSKRSAATKAK